MPVKISEKSQLSNHCHCCFPREVMKKELRVGMGLCLHPMGSTNATSLMALRPVALSLGTGRGARTSWFRLWKADAS